MRTPEEKREYQKRYREKNKERKLKEEQALQDTLQALQKENRDLRNELCQRCGKYREAYLGACDGCRWKDCGE